MFSSLAASRGSIRWTRWAVCLRLRLFPCAYDVVEVVDGSVLIKDSSEGLAGFRRLGIDGFVGHFSPLE